MGVLVGIADDLVKSNVLEVLCGCGGGEGRVYIRVYVSE